MTDARGNFGGEVKTKNVKADIEKTYFICPRCGERIHGASHRFKDKTGTATAERIGKRANSFTREDSKRHESPKSKLRGADDRMNRQEQARVYDKYKRNKEARDFYNSTAWKKCRKQSLQRSLSLSTMFRTEEDHSSRYEVTSYRASYRRLEQGFGHG
ncbi:hypothetical protein P7H20_00045 [Paenibacillus larvae]|nr:hypothetical protein [Paenibacillus larvae]MDT2273603.1 hypothetical protein [Paenibacillus larvae]